MAWVPGLQESADRLRAGRAAAEAADRHHQGRSGGDRGDGQPPAERGRGRSVGGGRPGVPGRVRDPLPRAESRRDTRGRRHRGLVGYRRHALDGRGRAGAATGGAGPDRRGDQSGTARADLSVAAECRRRRQPGASANGVYRSHRSHQPGGRRGADVVAQAGRRGGGHRARGENRAAVAADARVAGCQDLPRCLSESGRAARHRGHSRVLRARPRRPREDHHPGSGCVEPETWLLRPTGGRTDQE